MRGELIMSLQILYQSLPRTSQRFVMLLLSAVLAACTVGPSPIPDDPEYAPTYPKTPEPSYANQGSVFHAGTGMFLYNDRRAARVGDIITILLEEQTSSTKSAVTSVDKDNQIDIGDDTVLDTQPKLKNYGFPTSVDQQRGFAGDAASDQSNSLQGSIAVTVSEVLPNGLLVVRGEKWMTLNRGDEFIRIRGIIRQEDISFDNKILSSRVADARITYSGTGELADSNNMGWGSRFFNSKFWPF